MPKGLRTAVESGATARRSPSKPLHKHMWVISGPAGCGKTSLAAYLSRYMSLPYIEGDSFHPKSNIDKMSSGIPLTDADRWDWLILLRQQCVSAFKADVPGVLLSCSALKRKYRDVLRIATYNDYRVLVHFIHLTAPMQVLIQRIHNRHGHFMKDAMLKSQLDTLERPTEDEDDVFPIDVSGDEESVHRAALAIMEGIIERDSLPSSLI